MSYDRLAPTISSKARKNCLVPVTYKKCKMPGKCSTFGARPPVPSSDGLDTRPCKILDPHLHCPPCCSDKHSGLFRSRGSGAKYFCEVFLSRLFVCKSVHSHISKNFTCVSKLHQRCSKHVAPERDLVLYSDAVYTIHYVLYLRFLDERSTYNLQHTHTHTRVTTLCPGLPR